MQKQTGVSEFLSMHHIRPSYQRVKIMQYLLDRKSHPTIEEIYRALIPDIPTLSKTTVYNTLNLFIRERITQPLSIEENQTRYDADISVHGHFRCLNCGKIYDFCVDAENLAVSGLDGFQIDSRYIFYQGICPVCRKAEGRSSAEGKPEHQ
ncbi:MAG TPA: transcriptional repressor [Clostridia bacterium]|nr:transcriptional repressor [Clostridia bacterium]